MNWEVSILCARSHWIYHPEMEINGATFYLSICGFEQYDDDGIFIDK